jgi:hypothetical protein
MFRFKLRRQFEEGFDEHEVLLARSYSRAEFLKRLGIAIGVLLSSAILILLIILMGRTSTTTDAIRQTQDRNSPVLTEVKSGNALIKDCVTPEGQCFKDAQARTGQVVQSINDIVTLAVACADREGEQTVVEVRKCVIDALAKQEAK